MIRKFICAAFISSMLVAVPTTFSTIAAHADGTVVCNKPGKPTRDGNAGVDYDGTGKCTGANHDTWRFRLALAEEKVNWGPIPNDWQIDSDTYTTYSTWAANGATRYKSGFTRCSLLKSDWDYKLVFRYNNDWSDGHLTYNNYYGAKTELC